MSHFYKFSLAAKVQALLLLICAFFTGATAQTSRPPATKSSARGCITDCTPRFGIVSAFGSEAELLIAKTTNRHDYRINGNLFTTGMLEHNSVVIVLTGESIENASMLTQLLIDHFAVHHLLLSGIAGSLSDRHHIGDVLVPEKWALPLEGYWNADGVLPSPCGKEGDLSCLGMKLSTQTSTSKSDYQINTPAGPVSTGLFLRDTFVMSTANAPQGEFKFDYSVDPEMLRIARTLKPDLNRCGPKNPALCVPAQPRLEVGGRSVTIPMFLANSNYRQYLAERLGALSVDMETTAFAHVAFANGIPFIAFRALSDLAGGSDSKDTGAFFGSKLAETNEANVTLAFLKAWSQAHPTITSHQRSH